VNQQAGGERAPPQHAPPLTHHNWSHTGADSMTLSFGQTAAAVRPVTRGLGNRGTALRESPRARPPSWTACSGLQATWAVPSRLFAARRHPQGRRAPSKRQSCSAQGRRGGRLTPTGGGGADRGPAHAQVAAHTHHSRHGDDRPSARAHRAAPRLSRCDTGAARRGVPNAHPWHPPLCEWRR